MWVDINSAVGLEGSVWSALRRLGGSWRAVGKPIWYMVLLAGAKHPLLQQALRSTTPDDLDADELYNILRCTPASKTDTRGTGPSWFFKNQMGFLSWGSARAFGLPPSQRRLVRAKDAPQRLRAFKGAFHNFTPPTTGRDYVKAMQVIIAGLQATCRGMRGNYVAPRIARAVLCAWPSPATWANVEMRELAALCPDRAEFLRTLPQDRCVQDVEMHGCAPELLSMWRCFWTRGDKALYF